MTSAPRLLRSLLLVATAVAGGLAPVAFSAAPAAANTCPAAGGTNIPEATAPEGSEIAFAGHGLGHSLGLSQYGAQGAARLGCSYDTILRTYYPGTTLEQRSTPIEIKQWMLVNGTAANLQALTGAVTWQLPGCDTNCPPVQPKGATYRVTTDTARNVFALADMATGATLWSGGGTGETLTAAHSRIGIQVDTFRGEAPYLSRQLRWDFLRFTFDESGLDAVQSIRSGYVPDLARTLSAMDKYLWGVAEVPLSWTRDANEALRAQVVAARTYAYGKILAGTTTLFPTQANQNYGGYAKELEDAGYKDQLGRNFRWAEAVLSTTGTVVVDSAGAPVETFFTSSMGGYGEDVRYVWGGGEVAYLKAIDDSTWDAASSGGTYRSWARGFTKADVAAKLGFETIGDITLAARGTESRLAGVSVTGLLDGVRTTRVIDGWDLKVALNLPSPGFTVSVLNPDVSATKSAPPVIGSAAPGVAGGKITAFAAWTAPANDGGSPITAYRVQALRYDADGNLMSTTTSGLLPADMRRYERSLTETGTYRFRVRAENAVGASVYSAESNLVIAQ